MDISNFSKTKGLSRNHAINKTQATAKNERKHQFNLENFLRDVWPESDTKWQKYFPKKLPNIFNIQSGLSGRFGFFNFCKGKFSYTCL